MLFLSAVLVASVGVSVGTTVYSSVKQKDTSEQLIKNQKDHEVLSAKVVYGTALTTAPGSIPI